MKKIIFFGCILLGQFTIAQNKLLTIEDALINNRTTLATENLKMLQFIKGTGDYIYLKKTDGKERWIKGNFKTGEQDNFLSSQQLNAALSKLGTDTIVAMPAMQFSAENATFVLKGAKYGYDFTSATIKLITDKKISAKENVDISSSGNAAYLENDNLYIQKNGNAIQVTRDGSKDIVYASAVHQQEFGIIKGTFWSNSGNALAFYRMDQSMVPDYPIIDWTVRPAKVKNIRYPMAGDKSHHVTVGVYNVSTEKLIWLNTGLPAEQYLTNIAWSPDDKSIFIAVLNREQNHMWLNEYDAANGNFIRTLFEEQDDKYVEPLVPMLFLKNNPKQFIWQSRKDGWNHLYLYGVDGKLVKQLTSGNWEVTEVKGFDVKGENLYFNSTIESPLSRNLSSVALKKFNIKRITSGNYVHNTQVSGNGDFIIDNSSTPSIARTVDIIETKTGKRKNIFNAPDPIAGFSKGEISIFSIKNNDGQDMYCRMFKPIGFDSTKKYPVIVYWYGGPHTQLILNSWNGGAGDYWFQYMAERGFIILSIDTRGSSNRGRMFEQSIFRRAGDAQREDLKSAVQFLKSKSYVDDKNMGLSGWSYGGFMTTSFLLENPGVFKAAVAGGPVMDWKYYEIMYTERYMDTPQENPEGYAATNLISQAGKLKDKLLLIHGLQDPVVVQQHSVDFVRAAIDKNVQVDYMIYPGHEHNVLGKDRAHLFQKITDYFIQNLRTN